MTDSTRQTDTGNIAHQQQQRWERLLDQPRSPEAFHRALTWAVVQLMHEPDGFWPDGEYRYNHDAEWHARVERVVGCAITAAIKLMPTDRLAEALGADIVEPVNHAIARGAIPHDPRDTP